MLEPDNTENDVAPEPGSADIPAATATKPARAPRKRAPRKASATAAAPASPPAAVTAEQQPAENAAPGGGTGSDQAAEQGAPTARKASPRKAAPRKRAPRKAAATPAATTVPAGEVSTGNGSTASLKPARGPALALPVLEPDADSGHRDDASSTDVTVGGTDTAHPDLVATDPTETRPAKKAPRKRAPRKTAAVKAAEAAQLAEQQFEQRAAAEESPQPGTGAVDEAAAVDDAATVTGPDADSAIQPSAALAAPAVLFVAPSVANVPARRRRSASAPAGPPTTGDHPSGSSDSHGTDATSADADPTIAADAADQDTEPEDVRESASEEATGARRRRRRGRRGRGGAARTDSGDQGDGEYADGNDSGHSANEDNSSGPAEDLRPDSDQAAEADGAENEGDGPDGDGAEGAGSHRRRRRRRSGGGNGGHASDAADDDPPNTVVHVRHARDADDDGVKSVKGSTRLEAKRQRRKDGRDTSRRRPPILTEAEFLARRESVDRVMAVRQNGDRTQIAVLEDNVLVEHYVTRASATSYVGNVYLGRVQNVLPSMEAAFVDIGKGRNGVIYAGEVNWDAAGLAGKSRAIENALKPGDAILVQVTKDPIGHKGARLTSQVSLPGRFLVYVPGGGMTGISRKLPDTERHRLKAILKKIVPEDAGVIIRTAAEGATEEDLASDVARLQSQWESMSKKAERTSTAPSLVHGEPDLAIRVVRDVFNEDFRKLIVQGEQAWATVSDYVRSVAPELAERVSKHTGEKELFRELRVDEQLMKALDRKVWLPSGGTLVIDRTEAMTVIDVNTGKFIGAGGNLEQTVTRNNLEAAEEIVRQLRLRDVGGMVVIDFIDMVLESNRDLVLRRLTECLGRDRTKHQVAEVTSLGLVQMTRKRVGEGLLNAFSEPCEHCKGTGVIVHTEPVDIAPDEEVDEAERSKGKRKRSSTNRPAEVVEPDASMNPAQRKAALVAMAVIHRAASPEDELSEELADGEDEPTVDVETEVVDAVTTEPESTEPLAGASERVEVLPQGVVALAAEAVVVSAPVVAARRRRRAASRPAGPATATK